MVEDHEIIHCYICGGPLNIDSRCMVCNPPMVTAFCLCGGAIMGGWCVICGHKHALDTTGASCAECGASLTNLLCPRCDVQLVRDMTTPYHPYLWGMDPADLAWLAEMRVSL